MQIKTVLKHPLTLLALVWVVFWWPVLSGDSVLYIRDLTFYTVPMKSYMMERFSAGEFPFWTPYLSSGMPFFADPSHQVLYPLNFLYFLVPSVIHGISWQSLLHVLFGMWGMYWLGRVIRLTRWAAFWMSLLYAFCGYTVSVTDNINYVAGVAWVPVAMAAFLRGLDCEHRLSMLKYSTIGALCVALMVLAGDTFHPMGLGVFCALALLFRNHLTKEKGTISISQAALHLGVMYGLAALICSVQIIPTLELLKHSARNEPMGFDEITIWSFPPQRIVELIQPFFYGSMYPHPHFIGQFMYHGFREPWADSVYFGIIALLFAAAGLLFKFKSGRFWITICLTSLLLSMAYYWGESLFQVFMDVFPPITRQRYMEKFVYWIHFSLCVLAGMGAGYLLNNPDALWEKIKDRSVQNRLLLSAGILLGSALFLVHIPVQRWIVLHAQERSIEWGQHFYNRETHILNLYIHWFILMLFAIGLLWQRRDTLKKYLVLLMIVAVSDLGFYHFNHTPTARAKLFEHDQKPAALDIIETDRKNRGEEIRPVRIFYDDLIDFTEKKDQPDTLARIQNAYQLPYLDDSYYYHWLFRTLYNQQRFLFNSAIPWQVGYHNGRFAPLQPNSHKLYDNILTEHDAPYFAALSGIDYIITPILPEHLIWDNAAMRIAGVDRRYNLRVLAPVYQTPRAYLAPNAIYNPDIQTMYKIITDAFKTGGQNNHYRLQVELAQTPPAEAEPAEALSETAQVTLQQDKPEEKIITINSPYQSSHLVLTESWFPGWQASVDGKPAEIILANHRFMAVAIPPGQHTVVLSYRCNNVITGMLLSLAGLLLSTGLLFPKVWRGQRNDI